MHFIDKSTKTNIDEIKICVFLSAELQKRHEQEQTALTEEFQAAEDVLKVKTELINTSERNADGDDDVCIMLSISAVTEGRSGRADGRAEGL